MPRPPTTARMKVDCLLHYVYVQCGEYLKCRISGEEMKPGSDVQFDHIGALVHEGEHSYQNLRPVLNTIEGHKKKTKQDVKDNKKANRLENERNGLPKRARDKFKKKIPSRPFNKPAERRA